MELACLPRDGPGLVSSTGHSQQLPSHWFPERGSAYTCGYKSGALSCLIPPQPALLHSLMYVSLFDEEQGENLGEASERLKVPFSNC